MRKGSPLNPAENDGDRPTGSHVVGEDPAEGSAVETPARRRGGFLTWTPWVLLLFAAVTLVCLFLPLVKVEIPGHGEDFGLFSTGPAADSVTLVAGAVLTILGVLAAWIIGKAWARFAAGVLGTITGVLAGVEGFFLLYKVSQTNSALGGMAAVHPQFGLYLLCVMAVLMVLTGIMVIVHAFKVRSAEDAARRERDTEFKRLARSH